MHKFQRKILFAGLAAIVLSAGCARRPVENVSTIQTLPAVIGTVKNQVIFVGNVTGGQTSTLSWNTNGVIEKVFVKLGDTVREGQVLASLEADSLSSDVLSAEVPYINALEELEDVLTSETPKAQAYKDLKDKESELEAAEKFRESRKYPRATIGDVNFYAQQVEIYKGYYDDALKILNDVSSWRNSPVKSEYNTYEQYRKNMLNALNKYAEAYNNFMYYSGKATEHDVTQASLDIDVAKAEYEKALTVFKTYSDYPREKDLNAAQIKVENAQNTYNRRNIVAAINGEVTQLSARPGDYVTRNTTAARLDNTDHLYIPLDVSEMDILSIHDGMTAEVVLDSNQSKTYEGKVTTVSALGSSSNNRVTFQTMVEILKPDDNVKIGMTAEVYLITKEVRNVLIVPSNAVFKDGNNTYVSVSNGISCNDVPVTVGMESDTVAQIMGGFLKEGDAVCVPSVDDYILQAMGLDRSVLADSSENAPSVVRYN